MKSSVLGELVLNWKVVDLRETSDLAVAFSDQDKISEYVREPIAQMTRWAIMNGLDGGAFGPAKQAIRVEVAVMIYRLLQLY